MPCKSTRCYFHHYCDSELTGNAGSRHTLSEESEIPLVSTADRQPALDVTGLRRHLCWFCQIFSFYVLGDSQ